MEEEIQSGWFQNHTGMQYGPSSGLLTQLADLFSHFIVSGCKDLCFQICEAFSQLLYRLEKISQLPSLRYLSATLQ